MRRATTAIGILSLLIATACATDPAATGPAGTTEPTADGAGAATPSPDAASDYTVGVSIPEAQNPFYIQLGDATVAALEANGLQARLVSANSDVNEQIEGVGDLVASGIDLLLIAPLTAEGVIPALEEAAGDGIPIITFARGVAPEHRELITGFVGFSLFDSGYLKGEWVRDNIAEGQIAMLLGTAGAQFSIEQAEGFRAALEESDQDYEIVFEQNSVQTRENGLTLAQDALTAYPDLAVIYASNDDMALGAVQAVNAAGRQGEVAVLGLNGAPPATAAIHRGEMSMTVYFDARNWGQQLADVAAQYLDTGEVPPGTAEMVELIVVTQENACQYIPPPLYEDLDVEDCA